MATFKTLPAGVMRGDPRDVYPLLDEDNLPVGFTSSQGDTFMASYATDPLSTKIAPRPFGGASPSVSCVVYSHKPKEPTAPWLDSSISPQTGR